MMSRSDYIDLQWRQPIKYSKTMIEYLKLVRDVANQFAQIGKTCDSGKYELPHCNRSWLKVGAFCIGPCFDAAFNANRRPLGPSFEKDAWHNFIAANE